MSLRRDIKKKIPISLTEIWEAWNRYKPDSQKSWDAVENGNYNIMQSFDPSPCSNILDMILSDHVFHKVVNLASTFSCEKQNMVLVHVSWNISMSRTNSGHINLCLSVLFPGRQIQTLAQTEPSTQSI